MGGDGTFTVSATSALAQPLTVIYSASGSAILGSDYTLDSSAGQIVIPAGQTSSVIRLHAYPNGGVGRVKAKTAKLKLVANAGYKLPKKAGKTASIKIVGH
jgi:hypothetical protein